MSAKIDAVIRLRDRLVSQFFYARLGVVIDADVINSWTEELAKVLKVETSVLFASLLPYCGQAMSPTLANSIATLFAGNLDVLRAERPVFSSARPIADALVFGEIQSIEQQRGHRNEMFLMATVNIWTGPAVGRVARTRWPMRVLMSIAMRLGFSRRNGKYPLRHWLELSGLRICCTLNPQVFDDQLRVDKIQENGSIVTWNRKNILPYRLRKVACPRNYTHYCHTCPVGREACPGAVVPLTIRETSNDQPEFTPVPARLGDWRSAARASGGDGESPAAGGVPLPEAGGGE